MNYLQHTQHNSQHRAPQNRVHTVAAAAAAAVAARKHTQRLRAICDKRARGSDAHQGAYTASMQARMNNMCRTCVAFCVAPVAARAGGISLLSRARSCARNPRAPTLAPRYAEQWKHFKHASTNTFLSLSRPGVVARLRACVPQTETIVSQFIYLFGVCVCVWRARGTPNPERACRVRLSTDKQIRI